MSYALDLAVELRKHHPDSPLARFTFRRACELLVSPTRPLPGVTFRCVPIDRIGMRRVRTHRLSWFEEDVE